MKAWVGFRQHIGPRAAGQNVLCGSQTRLVIPAQHLGLVSVAWKAGKAHGVVQHLLDGQIVQHDHRRHPSGQLQETRVIGPGIADMDEERIRPVAMARARGIARKGAERVEIAQRARLVPRLG